MLGRSTETHCVAILFKLLYELNLWRGTAEIRRKLIEGMGHLAIMTGLSDDLKSKHIPEFLWETCWHFVGPDEIPMDREDVAHMKRCLDVMETLAEFSCQYERGRETIGNVTSNTENLFEIALWYSNEVLADKTVGIYEKAMKACKSEKVLFTHGLRSLHASANRMLKTLHEQKPRWRSIETRLRALSFK